MLSETFRRIAHWTANAVGSPWAFLLASAVVLAWAVTGPLFRFSDTWQLVINTGTTIVTFLMVFLIQNAQNRDAQATQTKLDELLSAVEKAHDDVIGLEDRPPDELEAARRRLRGRRPTDGA